jgi:hypothetical protein
VSSRFPSTLKRLKLEVQRWDAEEALPFDTSQLGGGLEDITQDGWVEKRTELMHLSLEHLQIQKDSYAYANYANVGRK